MTRAFVTSTLLLLVALAAPACFSSRHRTHEATEENFGVDMARQNLWREALFRFQRAVDLNPADAMAHNNLAVAWEANGEYEKAAKEYREAMRLDKTNQYIQKNYSRFVEFTSRNKKRQQRHEPPPTKSASATTTAPPETATGSAAPTATAPPPDAGGAATSPQPEGTAPAAVPPAATSAAPPPQPPPTDTTAPPPPVKPPGE